jgi:sugar/nucleoside kinase (ribokinase family)
VAALLTADDVPLTWQASMIHVGPIARECDISLVDIVGEAFLGVTPQGLMRGWDEQGYVSYREWENAEAWLARADAVVLSDEDLDGHQELVARYAAQTQVLIVTHGPGGCTVHTDGRQKHFRAPEATHLLDPTGAGDIFAAAFFILFHRTRHLEQAARFANCIAAGSVARRGLAGIPTDEEIAHCTAILGD